nr:metallophosphoesterase family protein [Salinibacter ruber]
MSAGVRHPPSPSCISSPVRIAVISDVHANLEALTCCLESAEQASVDAIYCLGDIVGYNADPSECLEQVRSRCDGIVIGNHDAVVAGKEKIGTLPPGGQTAAREHREQLSGGQIDFLASLPLKLQAEGCTFVHAAPGAPSDWKRLKSYPTAREQFEHFCTDVCFVGHTHVPSVMADKLGVFEVRPENRYIINVGSVGQPRDQNPKLSFGIFDTQRFSYENVRVGYNVSRATEKIRRAGNLPGRLARRLEKGV